MPTSQIAYVKDDPLGQIIWILELMLKNHASFYTIWDDGSISISICQDESRVETILCTLVLSCNIKQSSSGIQVYLMWPLMQASCISRHFPLPLDIYFLGSMRRHRRVCTDKRPPNLPSLFPMQLSQMLCLLPQDKIDSSQIINCIMIS